MAKADYTTVDEYIARCEPEVRGMLEAVRAAIRETAPDAAEVISWGMPTYKLNGNLVHFAAGKQHIGFYPGADGVAHFASWLGDYKTSKGAIQFPKSQPMPLALIREITAFRVGQNTGAGG